MHDHAWSCIISLIYWTVQLFWPLRLHAAGVPVEPGIQTRLVKRLEKPETHQSISKSPTNPMVFTADFGDFGPGHANRSNVSRSRPRHIRPSTERIRLDTNPVKRTRVTHVCTCHTCASFEVCHVCFLSGFPNFDGSSCPTCPCLSRHNPRALHQRITGSCARIASTSDWRLKWSFKWSYEMLWAVVRSWLAYSLLSVYFTSPFFTSKFSQFSPNFAKMADTTLSNKS